MDLITQWLEFIDQEEGLQDIQEIIQEEDLGGVGEQQEDGKTLILLILSI